MAKPIQNEKGLIDDESISSDFKAMLADCLLSVRKVPWPIIICNIDSPPSLKQTAKLPNLRNANGCRPRHGLFYE